MGRAARRAALFSFRTTSENAKKHREDGIRLGPSVILRGNEVLMATSSSVPIPLSIGPESHPRWRVLLLLVILAAWNGAAQEPPGTALPSVTLPPELDRVLRDYERAWEAKDAAALSGLFTDDGFVLSNGRPPVRGTAAIREAYAGSSGGPLSLRAFSYSVDGTVAYIIGAYSESPGKPDIGKFILALRKSGKGKWLIAADIDNVNRRPRPPAPASPQQRPGSAD